MPLRCAYCHDGLAPAAGRRCPGCRTALHVECGADAGRCPTLGCADPTLGSRDAPVASPRRWALRGLLLPAVAFAVDARARVNPLAWGYGGLPFQGEPDGAVPPFGVRALLVDGLVAASALGLALLLLGRARAALPLLVLGVAVAVAHAVAFVPLLPLSLVGALWLVGLLGLSPYVTTGVYLEALRHARGLAEPKGGPSRWSSTWLAAALGVALVPLALQLPRTITPYPAPAARPLAEAGLRPEDLEELRRWVATVVGTHEVPDPASAPARSRALWRDARVWPHDAYVEWGFPGGFSLLVLPPGVELPPNEGSCYRCVEVAPGAWSRYVRKTPPRDPAVFVRLPATSDAATALEGRPSRRAR